MSKESRNPANPLRMYQLYQQGPFVLPSTQCSNRRADFFRRGNAIIGFYTVMTITARQGFEVIQKAEQRSEFNDATPMRLESGIRIVSQFNYGYFKKLWANAGSQLTSQVFLMLYGNFEAFVTELVMDGLAALKEPKVFDEALRLMVMRRWRSKMDAIDHRLKVGLGKNKFVRWFKDIDMGFLGVHCSDPLDFLEKASDLRDRLVHYSGKADAKLVSDYPQAGLTVGQAITLPFELPFDMQFFLAHLSDLIDERFALTFGWPKATVAPERLIG